MVKSGLSDSIITENSVPRVSQYRLAAHLGTALMIYITMISTGWSILNSNKPVLLLPNTNASSLLAFKKYAHWTAGLCLFTALSGAFVAGLDAGLVYNTFPFMGDSLVPPIKELWLEKFKFNFGGKLKNLFENPVTVQLNHRALVLYCFYSRQ